jgi:hypothetical protein
MPVHRTPWVLIISAVVILVVVMAGCGTALAIIGARSGNVNGAGIVPSPSPGGSPSPIASPTGSQSATSASNPGVTVPVPSGWAVDNTNDRIILVNPDGTGQLLVQSGASIPAASAQENKDAVDASAKNDPKAQGIKTCPNSKTTTGSLNGAAGIFWTLCFTYISGAQSFPAAASLFAGANGDGSVYYYIKLFTAADNLAAFVKETKPILQGLQWKLK